jgi:hypothetical protein
MTLHRAGGSAGAAGMPGRDQGPRQLRLINVGELDNGGENGDEEIAAESWESVMEDIGRMIVRSGFRLIPVSESDEEVDEPVA